MMDWMLPWTEGLRLALAPAPLLAVLAGTLVGLGVGLWPGAGALAGIALLMPVLAGLDTLPALVLLAGVYHGAQVGGAWGTVLAAEPGEASAQASAADALALARQGRAGAAMAAAAWSSFAAGVLALMAVAALVPVFLRLAFHFGPAEYAALTLLALAGAVAWSPGSTLKAIAMAIAGLLLGRWLSPVPITAAAGDGVPVPAGFLALVVGVFLLGEAVAVAARSRAAADGLPPGGADAGAGGSAGASAVGDADEAARTESGAPRDALAPGAVIAPAGPADAAAEPGPTRRGGTALAALRGTALGALLGALPGGGAVLASFAALAVERRLPGPPGDAGVGHGSLRGVAAPEAANSAGAQAAFLPALTLGLPPNAAMALLIGTLALHGMTPGPTLPTEAPALLWGLLAAAAVGHAALLGLGLAAARLRPWRRWPARGDRPPGAAPWPAAAAWSAWVAFAMLGLALLQPGPALAGLAAAIGVAAVLLQRLGCPAAPLVLGVVLWPTLEQQLLRWMAHGGAAQASLAARPLAVAIVAAALLWVGVVALARWRGRPGRPGRRPGP
jgi:TctA family transporter